MKLSLFGRLAMALFASLALGLGMTACGGGTIGYMWVLGQQYNQIAGFKIDDYTGNLTQIQGSPFVSNGAIPVSIVVKPGGRYVYVINQGTGGGPTKPGTRPEHRAVQRGRRRRAHLPAVLPDPGLRLHVGADGLHRQLPLRAGQVRSELQRHHRPVQRPQHGRQRRHHGLLCRPHHRPPDAGHQRPDPIQRGQYAVLQGRPDTVHDEDRRRLPVYAQHRQHHLAASLSAAAASSPSPPRSIFPISGA